MLSLKDPKDIEEDRNRTLEQLPIYHRDWEKVISSGKEKRTRQIGSLMRRRMKSSMLVTPMTKDSYSLMNSLNISTIEDLLKESSSMTTCQTR